MSSTMTSTFSNRSVKSFQEIVLSESYMDKVYKEVAEIVKDNMNSIFIHYASDEYSKNYIKEIETKDYIIKVYSTDPVNGKKAYKYNFEFVL